MSHNPYAAGDTVTLKPDLFRSADSNRTCRILSVLPADHGEAQYRVRIGNEAYERRIVASDIEMPVAPVDRSIDDSVPSRPAGGAWLKPSSIRVKK